MTYPKCLGLMVEELAGDFFLRFDSFRCVQCGLVWDRYIVRNRRRPIKTRVNWEKA